MKKLRIFKSYLAWVLWEKVAPGGEKWNTKKIVTRYLICSSWWNFQWLFRMIELLKIIDFVSSAVIPFSEFDFEFLS